MNYNLSEQHRKRRVRVNARTGHWNLRERVHPGQGHRKPDSRVELFTFDFARKRKARAKHSTEVKKEDDDKDGVTDSWIATVTASESSNSGGDDKDELKLKGCWENALLEIGLTEVREFLKGVDKEELQPLRHQRRRRRRRRRTSNKKRNLEIPWKRATPSPLYD